MRRRTTASSILQGLTLLVSACALGFIYGDWARIGHLHVGTDGNLYHHHHHFGTHQHEGGAPPSQAALGPGNETPTNKTPADETPSSPTDPSSSDGFLPSALILGLDRQPTLTVQPPDRAKRSDVRHGTAWRQRDVLHDPATPRGPPSA
ncbi:MAG: hypothetical protein AAF657_10305 [Acidobacteriota bacterium]